MSASSKLWRFAKWIAINGDVPRYESAYANLEAYFRATRDPWHFERDRYNVRRFDAIVDAVQRVPHRSILDVGCAEGHLTRRLCGLAESVSAIDVSATAVARAREAAPRATALNVSLEDASFPEKFDVVVCAETIYYPRHPVDVVKKLNSLGHFILVSYTSVERDRLDSVLSKIPTLYDASCRYFRLFNAARIVNWQRSRVIVWWSGALVDRVFEQMHAAWLEEQSSGLRRFLPDEWPARSLGGIRWLG